MNQRKGLDFDYLINDYQEILWKNKNHLEELYTTFTKKIIHLLGIPNNQSYDFFEDYNLIYDEPYTEACKRYQKNKEIIEIIISKNHKHKINERNSRLHIYHNLNSYTIGLIDHIKKHYYEVFNTELTDNIKYSIYNISLHRFSINEESIFAEKKGKYNSYDNYLTHKLINNNTEGFKHELFEYFIEHDIYNDFDKEKFEYLWKQIYNYINYIIIPEIEVILHKIDFSRQQTTDFINLQYRHMKYTGEQLIETIKKTQN